MSERVLDWHKLTKAERFSLATDEDHVIKIRREVIPIIFVPGIMGTKLAHAGTVIWDPDDYGVMGAWGTSTAKKRKEKLIGTGPHDENYLQVHLSSADKMPGDAKQKEERFTRRWGGLLKRSYGSFMENLDAMVTKGVVATDFDRYFKFPVHGGGYNWTADARIAGKLLADYIAELKKTYTTAETFCDGVILITHSMGGLVARSATQLHGAKSSVFGVIHGVQPVTGSAAAFKRVRAGFGGFFEAPTTNPVLGHTTGLVTPIFANSPGALELLPTKSYRDNAGRADWLQVQSGGVTIFSKPQNGNPYDEIYRQKTCFWRLVNPDLILSGAKSNGTRGSSDWNAYLNNILLAEQFHDSLGDSKHPKTYQIYGQSSGGTLPTYDKVVMKLEIDYTWPTVNAPLTPEMTTKLASAPESYPQDSGQELTTSVVATFKLEGESINCEFLAATGSGDETVPVSSGKALVGTAGSKAIANADHEGAYKNASFEAAAFAALRRIIKDHFDARTAGA